MTAHFLFLAFLLLGGFVAWRWRRVWFVHAATAAYALVHVVTGTDCPLTPLEHELRLRAGQAGMEAGGFTGTHLEDVIYPAELTTEVRWAALVVIAVSWLGLLLLIRRDRRRGRRRGELAS
ncbi:DUF2784 domain-containing protein [Glycomyces tenuis]|uniref:DUF2784 domain-containing protein n=1 Tax=Glycomyces tenuis TaxID=58116 RepID=UPI003CCB8C0B